MNFTQKQINHFRSYERVRKSGQYNMFSSQARSATGLQEDDYIFVMENYSVLKEESDSRAAADMLLAQVDHS